MPKNNVLTKKLTNYPLIWKCILGLFGFTACHNDTNKKQELSYKMVSDNSYYRRAMQFCFTNGGDTIDNSVLLSLWEIPTLCQNANQMIMVIPANCCRNCIHDILLQIDSYEFVSIERFIVLHSQNYQTLIFDLSTKLQLEINDVSLGTTSELVNYAAVTIPFFFTVSKEGLGTNFFLPNRELPNLTKQYFQILHERGFI